MILVATHNTRATRPQLRIQIFAVAMVYAVLTALHHIVGFAYITTGHYTHSCTYYCFRKFTIFETSHHTDDFTINMIIGSLHFQYTITSVGVLFCFCLLILFFLGVLSCLMWGILYYFQPRWAARPADRAGSRGLKKVAPKESCGAQAMFAIASRRCPGCLLMCGRSM